MCGVGMVAIDPDATGLDGTGYLVEFVGVASPNAGTEAIKGIIGEGDGFFLCSEGGDGGDWTEYFFLEDTHFVMAFEDGGFYVVAMFEATVDVEWTATTEDLGTFLTADVHVAEDFLVLVFAGLGAHHGVGVEGVAYPDGAGAAHDFFHETVVDAFVDEHAAGAGADFALVEGEHYSAFDGFVEEFVVLIHNRGEEDVGAFAAEFHGYWNEIF